MALFNGTNDQSTLAQMAQDPTLSMDGAADNANGPMPDPPERYGKVLSDKWIPKYKRVMRTPTRRLRIATIGTGFSAMNLAYKMYHVHADRLADFCDLTIYESRSEIGGTWLVNTYPGVACDVPVCVTPTLI